MTTTSRYRYSAHHLNPAVLLRSSGRDMLPLCRQSCRGPRLFWRHYNPLVPDFLPRRSQLERSTKKTRCNPMKSKLGTTIRKYPLKSISPCISWSLSPASYQSVHRTSRRSEWRTYVQLFRRLLTFVLSDFLLDLGLDGFKIKARRCLHRWILDRSLRQPQHKLLNHHKAPELSCVVIVRVSPT